jgi:hypothetical protein
MLPGIPLSAQRTDSPLPSFCVQSKNAFMGYGPEVEGGKVGHCVMELVSRDGVPSYRVGSGFQYFGIVAGACVLA